MAFPINVEMPKLIKVGKRTFYLGLAFFVIFGIVVFKLFDKIPAEVLKDKEFCQEFFKMLFFTFDGALVLLLGGKLWSDKIQNGNVKKEE